MKIIIGLGNPTKEYEKTRHNAGFIILEELQADLEFPKFNFEKKFDALVSEKIFDGNKIILVKPQSFMNLSGQSVKKIMDFYKTSIEDIFVIHDDLDIELGKYKISNDSSAAGHNGVTSIFETLGTQKIKRIRIGIEGSERKKERMMTGSDFVLQNFGKDEILEIKSLAKEIFEKFFQ